MPATASARPRRISALVPPAATATNANAEYLSWCAVKEHAYHTPTGELTKWMDNAFGSKMKVPFYGKHPYEMSR